MPAVSSTLVAMSNNNNNTSSKSDVNTGEGTLLRRRTVNISSTVDDEAANDWEAVSDSEASLNNDDPPLLTLMEQVVLLGLKDKQGYLNFMNDNLSYVLRGCVLMELGMRGRIRLGKATAQRRNLADRLVQVVNTEPTGEGLLDETLKLLQTEEHSTGTWIDLLSGETWNPMKVGFQLKQVRERIAKGLVDKGVLRTQKHSFYLFDMATHPLVDVTTKRALIDRVVDICTGRGTLPNLRETALVAAATAGCVIEGALVWVEGFGKREQAFSRAEELLKGFVKGVKSGSMVITPSAEIVASVLQVFCKLDTLLY